MTNTSAGPRGAWVHLFSDTMCGHGCRTVERHGAIVGRTSASVTIQLFDWNVLDNRIPQPLPGEVLVTDAAELASLGAAVYRSYTEARPAELEAVAAGLGQCGHATVRPRRERPYEPVRSERERDTYNAEIGVLSPHELSDAVLDEAERRTPVRVERRTAE
ncbi:hypothetical protein [Gordonia terrae]|uniref:Uncharacterized protein n=1 Tax=Gordonia terrae NBRC 100016 TaxID=1089454 RepID=A0ABQ0HLN9_9ACTN|nr:hypothetical protein [Gordonia terrae]ANY24400.1 hypothetical protein BCM27_17780 [Gordonia terrae]GAB46780.1 hypothetical protein GOTRE_181_00590 [Gordonia terrae NBRC 100016]VTR10856.1 Uncharacterised protein [Clostridioides difficile]VTS58799.1 Uncharacterised protein [Gordonia terrae]